jgi:transcriptional antiterminator NusG
MNTGDIEHEISVDVGELVSIVDGPFKDFEGKVSEVDKARGKLKVLVNMFGRETPVELDFLQIKKI